MWGAAIASATVASRGREPLRHGPPVGGGSRAQLRRAEGSLWTCRKQLLVGGAFATIIITIAGQQSLSNIFAGLVLLLSRPFQVGDVILLRSGALGGELEGTVTEIGITYLRLDTGDDVMSLPNSQVLAAAVSRRTQPLQSPGDMTEQITRPG